MELCDEKPTINDNEFFKCGACWEVLPSISILHVHLQQHSTKGYLFVEATKTAFPRYESVSTFTQTTEDGIFRPHDLDPLPSVAQRKSKRKCASQGTNETRRKSRKGFATKWQSSRIESPEETTTIEQDESFEVGDAIDNDDEPTALNLSKKKDNEKNPSNLHLRIKFKGNKFYRNKIKIKKTDVQDDTRIPCKACKKSFKKLSQLKSHIKNEHHDLPYICCFCSTVCSESEELQEHQRSKHSNIIHQCELCNKVLSTRKMLEGHYLVHSGVKPFSCDKCEPKRYFTRKSQLTAHMQTHCDINLLQCEFCGKGFNARYLMINHIKHCGGEKPHKCEFCPMAFVSNHCLQRHRRIHTGEKPYICEVCAFACTSPGCLARHMRIHTGEKPYVCNYCKQEFAARGALKRHLRIHTQEKPYQCSFCSKAFTQKWNLKTHERQHTGEAPYQCLICGAAYKQNVLLKAHMKSHYNLEEMAEQQQQQKQHSEQPPHNDVEQKHQMQLENFEPEQAEHHRQSHQHLKDHNPEPQHQQPSGSQQANNSPLPLMQTDDHQPLSATQPTQHSHQSNNHPQQPQVPHPFRGELPGVNYQQQINNIITQHQPSDLQRPPFMGISLSHQALILAHNPDALQNFTSS